MKIIVLIPYAALLLLTTSIGCDVVMPIEPDDTYENYRFVKHLFGGSQHGEIHTTECSSEGVVNLMSTEWPRGGQIHTHNGYTLVTRGQARALLQQHNWETCYHGLCQPNP